MIELGTSGTYIYVSDNKGSNGQSPEQLFDIQGMVLAGTKPVQEIADALDVILANPKPENDPIEILKERGQFLLGVSECSYPGYTTVDGLLFAQCEGLLESGAFSVVRMATWIRQGREHEQLTDKQLTDALIDHALTDVHGEDVGSYEPWGIPVERTTRIAPLHPSESERPDGYIFGHKKDFRAIEGLSLPDELKRVIADVTATWHGTEIEGDSRAFVEHLRDTLDDWKLPEFPLD